MNAADITRKLRLAQAAAGSAILHGASADEVRSAVEAGIADALRIDELKHAPYTPPAAVQTADGGRNALDAFTAAAFAS